MEEHEYEAMVREHLEPIQDTELVFLKGHLVIEQLLTELLEYSVKEPARLNLDRLMYSRKLSLYLAICGNSIISPGLEKVLKRLNSLRNELAHNLELPVFHVHLVEWVEWAGKKKIENPFDEELVRVKLIESISLISAFLSGVLSANKDLKK